MDHSATYALLTRAIHAAFLGSPPPRSALFADGADDGDAADIRRALRGRRWTAVPRHVPIDERSGLSWFTPTARRHYLPLWLLASAEDGLVRLWTVSHLRHVSDSPRERQVSLALYTQAERHAICLFLRWIADTHADERADALSALTWWSDGSRA